MGMFPYYYLVPYQPDIAAALEALRQREFAAGRYNPAVRFPGDYLPDLPGPGAQHASVEDACAEAEADGTRSILDIVYLYPEPAESAAAPVPSWLSVILYGTDKPERDHVATQPGIWDCLGRGQCYYQVVYRDGVPSQLFFVGWSYD